LEGARVFERVRPLALALAACAAIGVATPAAATAACPGEAAPAPALTAEEYESVVLCLVNERRTNAGLRTLGTQSNLTRAAARHAESMVARGFFAHRSPSGRSPLDRVEASGYLKGTKRWMFGENLAWGYGRSGTPLAIVEGWVHSPAHAENLFRGRFRDVGVAAIPGTPGPSSIPGTVTVVNVYGYRQK
jgi:uncharacterized protein YkwD